MKKQVKILDAENATYELTIDYKIVTPDVINGGYEIPNYIDDEENSYIEIVEIIGTLPPNYDQEKESYLIDIINELNY